MKNAVRQNLHLSYPYDTYAPPATPQPQRQPQREGSADLSLVVEQASTALRSMAANNPVSLVRSLAHASLSASAADLQTEQLLGQEEASYRPTLRCRS